MPRSGETVTESFAGVSETHSVVVFFVGDWAYKLKAGQSRLPGFQLARGTGEGLQA